MLNIRLDGVQSQTSETGALLVRLPPYSENEFPLLPVITVGLVVQGIVAAPLIDDQTQTIYLRNHSTAGQILYISTDSAVTPADAQLILFPGESWGPVSNLHIALFAIADAAGAEIRKFVLLTEG